MDWRWCLTPMVAVVLTTGCSSTGSPEVTTGSVSPASSVVSGTGPLSGAAPTVTSVVPLETRPVDPAAPIVPATGGLPRFDEVGRIDGDLRATGHLVIIGSVQGQPVGRLVNLATDVVVAFDVDTRAGPQRGFPPVSVASADGLVLVYQAAGVVTAVDTATAGATTLGPAAWVAESDHPDRYWRAQAAPGVVDGADWTEVDLAGVEYRTQQTAGSVDPRWSTDAAGTTLHLGAGFDPFRIDGAWPAGRIGAVVLLAECETQPEVPPACPVRAFDLDTGAEIQPPIANEFVSTALNMDAFSTDAGNRYLLSARYRNDYFESAVIDLATGAVVDAGGAVDNFCGGTHVAWRSGDVPLLACGGTVIDVESGSFVRYGLGEGFGGGLAFFTE